MTVRERAPKIAGAYVAGVGTHMPASLDEPLGDEGKPVQDLSGAAPDGESAQAEGQSAWPCITTVLACASKYSPLHTRVRWDTYEKACT